MSRLRTFAWVVAVVAALLIALGVATAVVVRFGPMTLPLMLLVGLAYGWLLWAYLHDRAGRQDEFLQLLIVTSEAGAPLPPALSAYLRDRPHGTWHELWRVPLLLLVPPYYWLRGGHDRKVAHVALLIEMGQSLTDALRATPGVASRLTVLAAAVGESTGQLARCLRGATRGDAAPVWLAALPRLLYPPALLVFVAAVGVFWLTYLAPRMMRITQDMGVPLPDTTLALLEGGRVLSAYAPALAGLMAAAAALLVVLIVSPTARWYCPGLGRLQRLGVRSWVLRMLSVLLEGDRPAPEALSVLAGPDAMGSPARRRLGRARDAVCRGEPLADALYGAGLLPRNAVPLVRAAQAARNVPWALTELGEQMAARATRGARRASLLVFTVAVAAIGALVAVLALGMFLPLVKILMEMT